MFRQLTLSNPRTCASRVLLDRLEFSGIALATVASVMLLATTNQVCQQVAVIPFLWVLPLAIYLLSFIICFDNQRRYRRRRLSSSLGRCGFPGPCSSAAADVRIIIQIVTYSALLFTICMVCHGELVRLKPHQRYLISFYLMVAIGGAFGGLFVVVIAPWLFTGYWEFDLALWTSLLMLIIVLMRDPSSWIHERRPMVAMALLAGAIMLPELIGVNSPVVAIRRAALNAAGARRDGFDVRGGVSEAFAVARRWPGSIVQACAILGLLVIGGVLIVDIGGNRANNLIASRNFYGTLAVYSVDSRKPEGHY